MEFNGLHTLSLPFVLQDALIAVGAGVALLASLAFINLGDLAAGLAHVARRASTRPARCVPGVRPGRRTNHLRTRASARGAPGAGRRTEASCAAEPLGLLSRSTVSHLILAHFTSATAPYGTQNSNEIT